MSLRGRHRKHVQLNALGLDLAVDQRAEKIIIAAGERELKLGHLLSFDMLAV
jgi:hypothetical protein